MKVALVSCGSAKQATRCQARELYTSALFRYSLEVAESMTDRTFIISALHGLVEPSRKLAPYEYSVKQMTRAERQRWGERVVRELRRVLGRTDQTEVLLFAGSEYVRSLIPAFGRFGIKCREPMKGMSIGKRLQWLKRERDASSGIPQRTTR